MSYTSAKWQDALAEVSPKFRRNGDFTTVLTGRAARRKLEKEERRIAKQENREARR